VNFTSLAQTTGTETVTITHYDPTLPVCGGWSYDPITPTSGNVIASLSGSTDTGAIAIAGGNCTITEVNGTCSVIISDQAGNTETCTTPNTSTIDRTLPTIVSVVYTPSEWTGGSVTVVVTISETGGAAPVGWEIEGWTKSGNTRYTTTYTGNVTTSATFIDLASNPVTTGIVVANIDKIAPNCGEWSYNPSILTSGNVQAILTGSTDGES
jgi:hypothetical protein